MTRAGLAAVALGVAGSVAVSSQQVFKSGVDGVTVIVSVRQGNRPVGGLNAADFELRDNGVLQPLSSVAAEKVPVDVTLLLDSSSSVDGPQLQRLKQAVADTADLLRGDDRIRLVAISQVLHEVFGFRPRAATLPLDTLAAEGATSLYDGLAATMMHLAEPGRRQLIVAFTDGRDSTSIVDDKTAAEIARRSDAVVSVVVPIAEPEPQVARRLSQRNTVDSLSGAGNVTVNGRGQERGADGVPRVLTDIVAPTAGLAVPLPPSGSISRVFKTMVEDFRSSYVLQYVAEGVPPDGWHELSVAVTKRGRYDIRARKGYMGRGKIGASEEHRDTDPSRRPLPVRTGARPVTADLQVDHGPRRSGRRRSRQEQ